MNPAQNSLNAITDQDGFSSRDFRDALGRFATGVTIVTTVDAMQQPVGLTANSFNSVSLEPPLVLWSLAKSAGSMAAFAVQRHYAIHVLGADQVELAKRFANRGIADRFAGVAHRAGLGGVPILDGCMAWFECVSKSRHDEGDHVLFVGQVVHCVLPPDQAGRSPLIYHGGKFFTELPLS
jgi:flavin reductase (DIM6/NTAB) family NADH-FMN oxidoreductase RutF